MVLTLELQIFFTRYILHEPGEHTQTVENQFFVTYLDQWKTVSEVVDYPVLDEEKLQDLTAVVQHSPNKSMQKVAQQKNICVTIAHKAVCKKLNLIPCKVTVVQKLLATGYGK